MQNEHLSVYYFSGTHWDLEWYQTFQGFRFRLVAAMNELIEVLENDPAFGTFHLDGQTIPLEDYLQIEPGKEKRLKKLIADGRIMVGPWYVMPDEFLLSGESLIQNLLTGHRIAEKFGAQAWKYGYVCDIFGHIAQMPQIFAGFDIHYALLGRGTNEHTTPAHFIWKSPDGSECITFKLQDEGGYGSFCLEVLGMGKDRCADPNMLRFRIRSLIEGERERSTIPVVLLMDGQDHEKIHKDVTEYLEIIRNLYPDADVKCVSIEQMGRELEEYRSQMPVKCGELNETAKKKAMYLHLITHTLSSRYPIKQANDSCEALLEKWAVPLTTIASIRGFDTQRTYLDLAYKYLLQNHPHDSICGCSINQVHKDMEYRFDQCRLISEQLIESVLQFESAQIIEDKDSQTRVLLVFNPLPFARKEVITADIDFNLDYPEKYQEPFGYELKNSFKLMNASGAEIPYGLAGIRKNSMVRRQNQSVEQVDIHTIVFEAELPAMGFAEYRVEPFSAAPRYLDTMSRNEREAENENLKLTINADGTVNLLDKPTGREYTHLLSYLDDGEIGDGWYHVNPAQDSVITSAGSGCVIERCESGPSRAVFRITTRMQVPECMEYSMHGISRSKSFTTLNITSLISLARWEGHINVETTVTNTARDHRLRLKIPTGIPTKRYFASQAFAFVERATGIDLTTQTWKECDVIEKQMGGIVCKRNADHTGLAFISPFGLHECAAPDDEEGTILVTLFRSFGKTVMTDGEEGGQLQRELRYQYAIAPMEPDFAYCNLIQIQDCLKAGVRSLTRRVSQKYAMRMPQSFFELSGDGVCMSILKRHEGGENNRLIVRLYNMSDKPAHAKIRFFKNLTAVQETNLNEEIMGHLAFSGCEIMIDFEPWKIRTLLLKFE